MNAIKCDPAMDQAPRRSPRISLNEINVNGDLTRLMDGKEIPFYIINISREGFSLWVAEEVMPQSMIVINFGGMQFWELHLGNNQLCLGINDELSLEYDPIDTIAKVVWSCKNQEDEGYSMGVEITRASRQADAYQTILGAMRLKNKMQASKRGIDT